MVKLMICVRRRPDLTSEQFHQYWREIHGPTVLGVDDFMRHIRRYVQCHTVGGEVPFPSQSAPYDGVAELWFDSPAEAIGAFKEARYQKEIRPDELKFADIPGCSAFLTEEVVMFG